MPPKIPSGDQPAPTEAELGVLRVLWDRGASTVREVFEVIANDKAVGYTTVLKQMQVMHQKGLLTRSERFRSHVYEPTVERSVIAKQATGIAAQAAGPWLVHQLASCQPQQPHRCHADPGPGEQRTFHRTSC